LRTWITFFDYCLSKVRQKKLKESHWLLLAICRDMAYARFIAKYPAIGKVKYQDEIKE
jgi:hypothetical protein